MKLSTIFQASAIVSNQAYSQAPKHIESIIADKLRMQLAAHIGQEKVVIIKGGHHVDFRIEMVVCSVDEFFEEVRKHADSERFNFSSEPIITLLNKETK